jgi:heptosyltransferase II
MRLVKPTASQRILVIRHKFIGDTVLLGSFLKQLRGAYPQAHITVLVAPGSGELLLACPYINQLLWLPSKTEAATFTPPTQTSLQQSILPPIGLKGFLKQVAALKQHGFDTAFVLKRSLGTAALVALAGIPKRVGFATEGRAWLLTQAVPYPPLEEPVHEAETFLHLLQAVGVETTPPVLEAWLPEAEQSQVSALWGKLSLSPTSEKQGTSLTTGVLHPNVLHPNVLQVGLQLSSSNPAKQWPLTRWQAFVPVLAQRLQERGQGVVFHGVGSASDAALYEQLRKTLPSWLKPRLVNMAGRLSLLQNQAWLQRLHVVVGNDSGTLHMAAAVNTPVVAIFGPMSPSRWAPLVKPSAIVQLGGLACQPCHLKTPCHLAYNCLTDLEEQKVLEAFFTVLGHSCCV